MAPAARAAQHLAPGILASELRVSAGRLARCAAVAGANINISRRAGYRVGRNGISCRPLNSAKHLNLAVAARLTRALSTRLAIGVWLGMAGMAALAGAKRRKMVRSVAPLVGKHERQAPACCFGLAWRPRRGGVTTDGDSSYAICLFSVVLVT